MHIYVHVLTEMQVDKSHRLLCAWLRRETGRFKQIRVFRHMTADSRQRRHKAESAQRLALVVEATCKYISKKKKKSKTIGAAAH